MQPIIATAAIHQLSFVKTDSPTLQTLDLVASTDFDFDAATPTLTPSGTALNRALLSSVFASMAQTMFTMTEGRHRVGTVYVYRNNRFTSNVDMKVLGLVPGRSNANPAGLGKRGTTSTNYLAFSATQEESVADFGKTIAHEHGHYLYGLFDEYREEGRPLGDIWQPAQTDTPPATVMADHRQSGSFSTAADYLESTQTAQKRVFGQSAWETLSKPATSDTGFAQQIARTAYPAFAGFAPANPSALNRPVTGWDAAFKVEFVPDPAVTDVYVISKKLTAEQLTGVKNAVVQSLRQLTLDAKTSASVVTYPGSVTAPVFPMQSLDTEAKRSAAIAAVEAISIDATAGDLTQTLEGVLDTINALYTANNLKLGDAISLNVFAGEQDAISVATRQRVMDLRVAVNANVITFDGIQPGSSAKRAVVASDLAKSAMRAKMTASTTTVTLAQLSHATGGHFTDANRISALTTGALKARDASSGAASTSLSSQYVNNLAVGKPFEVKTPVLAKTDGKLSFIATWADDSDNSHLRFELTAPDGSKFVPTNAQASQSFGSGEVSYLFDAESNTAEFVVAKSYVGRNGVWTSSVIASATVAKPIEQEVEAESTLRAEIDVIADGTPNPTVAVRLAADRAVQGAVATALFYGADGSIKLTKKLLDNGTGGDVIAGDGIYSAQLGGLLAAGQYDVVVNLVDGPSGAVFSTAGSTVKGINQTPEAVGGPFSRTADTFLTIAPTLVVEYFVPSLRKYFITGRESEKATLAQYPAIFTVTGMSFVAGPGAAPPVGTQPICRYFAQPPVANSTHFYGNPADCALLSGVFRGNAAVTDEGVDFAVAIPDAAGNCPASAPVKVYRSFNNRSAEKDGNHRYTVSTARYDQMAAAGYSRDGAVFCAASATDSAQ